MAISTYSLADLRFPFSLDFVIVISHHHLLRKQVYYILALKNRHLI